MPHKIKDMEKLKQYDRDVKRRRYTQTKTQARKPWEPCPICKEYRIPAIRKTDGICHNCANPEHKKNVCAACGLLAPIEMHHIVPTTLGIGSEICIPLCMNCHAVVTRMFVTRVYTNMKHHKADNIEEAITHALQDVLDVEQERRHYNARARNRTASQSTH